MNLQEFRSALESDATKRADAQETVIKNLHETIKMLRQEMLVKEENSARDTVEKDRWIAQLERRCHALTHGLTCSFCGHSSTCAARKGKQGEVMTDET